MLTFYPRLLSSVYLVRIWGKKCGAKVKNGLGRNINGPTRPSGTLPKSAIKITQNIQII